MSKNGEIYTAGKNFTLPPGLTGWTNSTSDEGGGVSRNPHFVLRNIWTDPKKNIKLVHWSSSAQFSWINLD